MAGTDNDVSRLDSNGLTEEPVQGHRPDRRDFLRYWGGLTAAGTVAGAGAFTGTGLLSEQTAQAATTSQTSEAAAHGTLSAVPVRPPAAPLAVRGPYLSTWLPATALPGTWQEFWQGQDRKSVV